MRIIILSITLSLILLTNNIAQWEILNEGFKGQINTIDFVNDNVGWIAGSNGTLIKTTDGGENWIKITINENQHFGKIDFLNGFIGWAIGGNGDIPVIRKTSDGGLTWFQQLTNIGFGDLYVIDASNVYAIGGDTIFKTTNGGTSWIDVSPNLPDRNYNTIWFKDTQTGVVVGNYNDGTADRGIILRTTNGGTSWDETIVNEFNSLYDLQFLDDTNGYFRANLDTSNFICKTEDMLLSWSVTIQQPFSISSYQFLDNMTVYAIIGDTIVKSNNGGNSWFNIGLVQKYISITNKLYFINLDNGFILCTLFGGSLIFRSNDGGISWTVIKNSYPLNDVYFFNAQSGIVIGGEQGGKVHGHWAEGRVFTNQSIDIALKIRYDNWFDHLDCFVINDSVAFSLGTNWGISEIIKTNDRGNNWIQVYSNMFEVYFFYGKDVGFLDEQNGFVVGRYGDSLSSGAGILKTTNVGETWNLGWQFPDTTNYEYNLKSIHLTETTGWAVGDGGMILKYTSQTGWVKQTSITDLPLNKVFFIDDNHGWILCGYQNNNGFQAILLKTTDGGIDWNTVVNVPYLIRDIAFIDNNFGWAIGYDSSGVGGILKSTDGGNSWTMETGNLSAKLNALHIKEGYGWAVGENGLILRTTNAGPTWVENDNQTLPTEFMLAQNYPNPFNPTTKIKYRIPLSPPLLKGEIPIHRDGGFVTLKVYDVLGREVATLINEEKPAGVYEVDLDGKNLSSGIYLYRLRAGNFIAVRKAILLK